MDYLELAQACSMRMCPELEKKFPDFHGRQLEFMMYLCLVAYNSEIYDGLCDDAWLRTTITLKDDHVDESADCAHVFSNSDSREIRLMAELFKGTPMCQSSWEQLERYQSTLTSRIEIRWNLLPRRAYWERLQKLQRQSDSTSVQSSLLQRTPCCSSRRGFIPITVIDQARQKGSSLKEKVNEWRTNGGRCDLATHLQSSVVRPTARRESFRTVEPNDVVSMEKLGKGSAATVYKVSWRKGTYAMKSFKRPLNSEMTFKERDIAAKVLHPHIIHGFGYFKEDGKWRLLMEMLDTNLTKYAIEKTRMGVEALFSREDTVDVLLQIASAVEHLHLKNVVHGDLKSDNIVLGSFEILGNGRHFLAKVTDLGDAQFIVPEQTFRPAGNGTTNFAAPELLEWRTNRNTVFAHPVKIDVYSFGGVALEVLTGYPPYPERKILDAACKREVIVGELKPSGSELWRNSGLGERFPIELIQLVEQCWELRPEDRPSFPDICEVLKRCKSMVQMGDDRAAEERRTAKKRAAELWKFFAVVSLFAFIWISSLTTEKSAVDPFTFIALTLFTFLVMSYLYKVCLCVIRCVICDFRNVICAVKVKDFGCFFKSRRQNKGGNDPRTPQKIKDL